MSDPIPIPILPRSDDQPKPRPPGHIWLATEFPDAVKAHGKPFGVFDPDRQLPYRG
jgi:hypothetical protein